MQKKRQIQLVVRERMNSICPMNFFRTTDTTDTTISKPGLRKPSCTAWASAKFYCESKTGNPEQAISLHLARSGSQSQRGIWFILPTHGASRITAKYYFQWSPRVACPTSLARRVHFDFSLVSAAGLVAM